MAMRLLPGLAVLLVTLAVSCSGGRNDSSCYANIGDGGWRYGDVLTFTPCHPDSVASGKLVVMLRHDNDYPYSNLWLEIGYGDSADHRLDTVNVHLCDVYGKWYGSGIGARYQLTDTVVGNIVHRSGSPVTLRHVMRVDSLAGIEQIGVAFVQ